jgi:rhodanese-related sulfurtransferase
MSKVQTIAAKRAHDLMSSDPSVVLVCAYEKDEDFRKNDLEGSISLVDFRRRRNSLPKDETIIFYCACPHDEGAIQQAKELTTLGFTNVKVLDGGVNAWKTAGYMLVGSGQ